MLIGSCQKKLEALCILYLSFAWIFARFHPLNTVSIAVLLLLMGLFFLLFFCYFCPRCHVSLYIVILNSELLIFLEKLFMQIFGLELMLSSKGLSFLLPVHRSTTWLRPLNFQSGVDLDHQMVCILSKNPHVGFFVTASSKGSFCLSSTALFGFSPSEVEEQVTLTTSSHWNYRSFRSLTYGSICIYI